MEWAEKVAREELEKLAAKHLGPIATRYLVLVGDPAEKILETVENDGVDLVVIGKRRDRSRFAEWLLGSTSYSVVPSLHCDVFIVK